MRIAIMTQPLGTNYGGIMQAWALQQVLKRMGHYPVTIDRRPDPPTKAYKAARLAYRAGMKAIGKRKAPINLESYQPTILQHTRSFIDHHIMTSDPLYSTRQIGDHFSCKRYDAVIVGSDQTWRPKYSPNIYNYFLDFLKDVEILRIAYASSFGVDDWEFSEEQTGRCAELARKFSAISVREDSGLELCRRYFGVEATYVLDPTLLLDKEDYLHLMGDERAKTSFEGIFTYFLDRSPEKQALAEGLSGELQQPIYSCQPRYALSGDFSDIEGYTMPDVRDWLAGFSNAKFVLTDSFHGMVFSLIFGKPFYVIKNKKRGAARFTSLLSVCGLEGQILDDSGLDNCTGLANALVNIGLNDDAILHLRKVSRSFLIETLS